MYFVDCADKSCPEKIVVKQLLETMLFPQKSFLQADITKVDGILPLQVVNSTMNGVMLSTVQPLSDVVWSLMYYIKDINITSKL